jgi:lipopolysaccharide transport system permease protein
MDLSDRGHLRDLVVQLTRREVTAKHRFTLLGWTWPLVRQLVQLGVLLFVFTRLFDLGQNDYAVFLFIGLIAFAWFSAAVTDGATSVLNQRHLVNQPRFPSAVVPVVAVAVPFVDVLLAVPVLVGMLVVVGELAPSALLFAPLVAIQFVLLCGLAWVCGAAAVYLRDIPNVVLVTTLLLFYVTPVFYSFETLESRRVGEGARSLLELNPLGVLIEAYRAVLIGEPGPSVLAVGEVAVASVALAALGLVIFRRLEPRFADEL